MTARLKRRECVAISACRCGSRAEIYSPQGVYRHPDREKYRKVSERLHEIWCSYADVVEFV
ncbi:MAG: hypothetical protein IJR68_11075, partial [Fretibacterium sp.]|nr:hypothetical protein [Fretibacterium sp.]